MDEEHESSPERSRSLPWQALVAATVLAFLAATLVIVLLRDDGDDADVATDGTLQLTPDDPSTTQDPLEVPFTQADGTTGTLADLVGDRPIVVNFFASWCPPCVGEMPDFETVHQELGDQVRFVGLAVQDREEDTRRIVEETGITYDWYRDISGDVVSSTGVVNMPTTMLVDTDGTIVTIHPGSLDAQELRDMVAEDLGVSA